MATLDETDRKILALLQEDARLTQAELAKRLAMSQTSCWRRVRQLEEAGVIARVSLTEHSDANRASFESLVASRPEVVECYSMTGDRDYMLRVVVRDVEAYDRFLTTQLLHHPAVASASSSFALKQVKYTTSLPLELA